MQQKKQMIGQKIDHYRIDTLLGKGGIGTVYKAKDLTLTRHVTIKVVYPQIINQRPFHEHILQQAKAASRLTHPSIATIYNFDYTNNSLYLAMEYVPGRSLASILGQLRLQNKILRLDEALLLTAQVADALAYAHQHGMLHRNLKPSNILIKQVDNSAKKEPPLRAVVTDFGMTRLISGDVKSAPVALADALPYMSPEQCIGSPIDGRSDIYSLGIILYQLTTRVLPFDITSPTEAMVMHALEVPPSPRIRQPAIPKSVVAIINKAMEKQPSARYQDAEEMADELRTAAATLSNAHLQAYSPGTFITFNALASLTEADALAQASGQNASNARPIDSWLPLPEDELIGLLQQELDVAVREPDLAAKESAAIAVPSPATPEPSQRKTAVIDPQNTPIISHKPRSQSHRTPRIAPPVEISPPTAQVIISRAGRAPRAIKLNKDTLKIGRSRDNDIVLSTYDVSRHHARLEQSATGWQIVDLNSSGGTYRSDHKLIPNLPESWDANRPLRIGPYTLQWRQERSPRPFCTNEQEDAPTKMHQVPDTGTQTSSRTGQFSLVVNPTTVSLAPGNKSTVQVELFNLGTSGDHFSLRVVDLPTEMVMLTQNKVYLAPGSRATLPISLNVPTKSRIQAGPYPYQIIVRAKSDLEETAVISARVTVTPSTQFSIKVWPSEIKNNGQCQVLIRNEGNATSHFSLVAQATEPSLQFTGERGQVRLKSGQATTLSMTVSSNDRPFWGRRRRHPFGICVRNDADQAKTQSAKLVLHPIIPPWILPVVEVLLIILFAMLSFSKFFGDDNTQMNSSSPPATPFVATSVEADADGEEIAQGTDPLRFPLSTATHAQPHSVFPTPVSPPPLPQLSPTANNIIQLPLIPEGSGWLSENGTVGHDVLAQAGDLESNEAVRGYLSYDLSAIPSTASISSATLTFANHAEAARIKGTPFNNLNCLLLEASEFALPLDAADYDLYTFYIDRLTSQPTTVDVLANVQDAMDFNLPYLQIRFGFTVSTDEDGMSDLYQVHTAPKLEVVLTP